MENRITQKTLLLDEKGNLTNPGYATKYLFEYNKENIKAAKFRIKEWEYYYVGNSEYAVALTLADNGYMGLLAATVFDFKKAIHRSNSKMTLFPLGKMNIPKTTEKGDVIYKGNGIEYKFLNDGEKRHLICNFEKFEDQKTLNVDIILTDMPEESMVIATPFAEDPKAFYFNQKINCMQASGEIKIGSETLSFSNNNSLGTLDSGRGVWTYKNTWYWGSLSTVLENGDKFGFNIGYGFGNTKAASENMLFYNGKAHKLSQVIFHIPTKDGEDDFLSDWEFSSDNGRFEMKFHPILDRNEYTNLLILCSKQHQVFGEFTGKAILDDGKVIELKSTMGFAEKVFNKW